MSLNFLRIAAPVSTSHETYTNLSNIKPMKKERNRRCTCKDGVSTIALKNKYQTTVVEGKYMETNWESLLQKLLEPNRQFPEVRSVAVSTMIMLSLELDQKDYLPTMVCTYSKVM
eukprot:jgi/Psemu1/305414/fgenesh1_kg.197_\